MTLSKLTFSLFSTLVALGVMASAGSAQQFQSVGGYGPEHDLPTHNQVQHAFGPAASHGGNEGLPMRDTYGGSYQGGGYQGNNSAGIAGDAINRQQTIWERGGMSNEWGNYVPKQYNYQFDAAQFQQSVQQLQAAFQQIRAARQQRLQQRWQQQQDWQYQQQQQYYQPQYYEYEYYTPQTYYYYDN